MEIIRQKTNWNWESGNKEKQKTNGLGGGNKRNEQVSREEDGRPPAVFQQKPTDTGDENNGPLKIVTIRVGCERLQDGRRHFWFSFFFPAKIPRRELFPDIKPKRNGRQICYFFALWRALCFVVHNFHFLAPFDCGGKFEPFFTFFNLKKKLKGS